MDSERDPENATHPPVNRSPLGKIKFLQINLNHAKKAMQSTAKHINENNIDIALLQDTYDSPNSRGLFDFPTAWRTFESKNKNAHVVIVNQNLIINHLLATEDAVFVQLTA